nr:hypothetical protein BN341_p110 [Helicobacter heilmannii ASB1.4]
MKPTRSPYKMVYKVVDKVLTHARENLVKLSLQKKQRTRHN